MTLVKKVIKRLSNLFLRPIVQWYISKDRHYRYKNLKLLIRSGVFHPGLFFSSRLLAEFVEVLDLSGKKVLEPGAGSGLISLVAARKGAIVTASDINRLAVENIQHNAHINKLSVTVLHSDLFDDIPVNAVFDYIILSPPYYPRNPSTEAEMAWYCGSEFQYFKKLFSQLKNRQGIHEPAIYMILSEECRIDTIENIGLEHGFTFELVLQKKVAWEWQFIYHISLN